MLQKCVKSRDKNIEEKEQEKHALTSVVMYVLYKDYNIIGALGDYYGSKKHQV
jgi:hypothetical protein